MPLCQDCLKPECDRCGQPTLKMHQEDDDAVNGFFAIVFASLAVGLLIGLLIGGLAL